MLREAGISSFQESYYVKNDNQCTINFSYLSEEGLGVVCYILISSRSPSNWAKEPNAGI